MDLESYQYLGAALVVGSIPLLIGGRKVLTVFVAAGSHPKDVRQLLGAALICAGAASLVLGGLQFTGFFA